MSPALALGAEPAAAAAPSFVPQMWLVLPFVGMLLSLAVGPMLWPQGWARRYPLVALGWSVVAILLMAVSVPGGQQFGPIWGHRGADTILEYVSFVILLGSLYVVAGGIHLAGGMRGTPLHNAGLLLAGSVLASVIGTTGAAMLLVRPLIQANAGRRHVAHVLVFFILLVCNVGGLLTPVGDPPLFLGFLMGVPFLWTLRLLPEWGVSVAWLLAIFFVWDTLRLRRDGPGTAHPKQPLRLEGPVNVVLLVGVLLAVMASGTVFPETPLTLGPFDLHLNDLLRDGALLLLAALSLAATPRGLRAKQHFHWGPIVEVTILFGGIFATMIPALQLLAVRGHELGVTQPAGYFWMSGLLSSVLDNAPTYVTFVTLAHSALALPDPAALVGHITGERLLAAVSVGSVFFGGMTYIGNGPNLMVKAIADHRGVHMPHFFHYALWAWGLGAPLFLAITLIFFR